VRLRLFFLCALLSVAHAASASAQGRAGADWAGQLLANLTLEEKASLTSGGSFWTTKAVERAGIPAVMLTDGPHGLRKQAGASDHLGLAESVAATCFPPAVGLGSSWDAELAERVGEALGVESSIENVAGAGGISLAPFLIDGTGGRLPMTARSWYAPVEVWPAPV